MPNELLFPVLRSIMKTKQHTICILNINKCKNYVKLNGVHNSHVLTRMEHDRLCLYGFFNEFDGE